MNNIRFVSSLPSTQYWRTLSAVSYLARRQINTETGRTMQHRGGAVGWEQQQQYGSTPVRPHGGGGGSPYRGGFGGGAGGGGGLSPLQGGGLMQGPEINAMAVADAIFEELSLIHI